MSPTARTPAEVHRERLHQLAVFLRESEQILADWDAYSEDHSDLDGWPLDDVAYGLRAAQRDADTWRSFNRVRSFAKDLLATAEVQVQQLNAAHLQPRWPWQLATLDYALKQLDALQQDWLEARDALPPSARPGSPAYDDALAERNAEAWSSLDDWASHGKAVLEIQATAQDLPPRSPALTTTVNANPCPPRPRRAVTPHRCTGDRASQPRALRLHS
ncbi:hypothetical protein ACM01_15855 [Streptomyces viridochromogenes]|uniref:Uncharacterized protein n=1 Tax=Streptomyces viridochromogenes TaxID=1938 RepID=A0A0J8C899_STRVR|nr:hypothetical protein [Streptomyces viridochromogenes]KMS74095.1 hypothetical protein ACM01_15855 [Streptomyces viridochromogenes]